MKVLRHHDKTSRKKTIKVELYLLLGLKTKCVGHSASTLNGQVKAAYLCASFCFFVELWPVLPASYHILPSITINQWGLLLFKVTGQICFIFCSFWRLTSKREIEFVYLPNFPSSLSLPLHWINIKNKNSVRWAL